MTIKHNLIPYIIPGLIALFLLVGGIDNWGNDAATAMVIIGVVLLLLCWGHRETETLSFKNGQLTGREAFRQLNSPADKIQYVEYSGFACFNYVKINCITGQYDFKNMRHAKKFVDYVNHNDL